MSAIISKRFFWVLLLTILILPAISYAQTGLVNINTAGSIELQTLNGVGPAYAQRIIDYRNLHGPFVKIEDIKNVSGIGEATYAKIKDFITVGNGSGATGTSSSSTSTTTAENTTSSALNSSGRNLTNTITYITYYNSVPLTDVSEETKFAVGAGLNRLGSVGSPLEFKAETNVEYTRNSIFKWNFGDGYEGFGKVLNHTYEYPGEYLVVLKATSPDGLAVARVNVKIIEPEIIMVSANPDRIELKNNSQYEISLYGRALISEGRTSVFPQDTIIGAGQKISFSSVATGLTPLTPNDVLLVVIGSEFRPARIAEKVEEQRTEKLTFIKNKISELQKELALERENENNKKSVVIEPLSEDNQEEGASIYGGLSQKASTIEAVYGEDLGPKPGWFEVVKRFFFRTN